MSDGGESIKSYTSQDRARSNDQRRAGGVQTGGSQRRLAKGGVVVHVVHVVHVEAEGPMDIFVRVSPEREQTEPRRSEGRSDVTQRQ